MKRTKTFQTGRPGTAELNSATADYFRDVAAMPDLFNDIFIQIDAHKKSTALLKVGGVSGGQRRHLPDFCIHHSCG